MFYGDFIKSGLQNPHETIYMPHYIPHAGKEVESVFVERTNLIFFVKKGFVSFKSEVLKCLLCFFEGEKEGD